LAIMTVYIHSTNYCILLHDLAHHKFHALVSKNINPKENREYSLQKVYQDFSHVIIIYHQNYGLLIIFTQQIKEIIKNPNILFVNWYLFYQHNFNSSSNPFSGYIHNKITLNKIQPSPFNSFHCHQI
jgi:hypothetical protein